MDIQKTRQREILILKHILFLRNRKTFSEIHIFGLRLVLDFFLVLEISDREQKIANRHLLDDAPQILRVFANITEMENFVYICILEFSLKTFSYFFLLRFFFYSGQQKSF